MTKILTEVLTIDISACNATGVYLRWKNEVGFIDQWLFQGNIIQDSSITDTVQYQKFIDDLTDVTENFKVISKTRSDGLRVFTTFEKDNAEGFRQMFSSTHVQMYVDGTFYRVDVVKESFEVQKDKNLGRLSLQVVLPLIYSQ